MTKEAKKQHLILKDKNIYKGLIILAFPLMINNLIKTLHDIIDMFFVTFIDGAVSSQSVAAIQLTFPVVFTFVSLGMGLSIAGTALISQTLGAKKHGEAQNFAANLVIVAITTGIILNIVAFMSAPYIMQWMGAEGTVLENSIAYMRIRAFELPVLFSFFAYLGIRQASGDTFSPVLVSGSAILLNILLSPLFIIVFNLGVPGAALATVVAHALIMPIGIIRLFFAKDGVTLTPRHLFSADFSSLHKRMVTTKQIIKTAVPAAMGQSITAIGFGVMNGVIYSFGEQTVAAFGVGNRLLSMILHPVMAMGAVLAAFIGQNIGAHNIARAKETFRKNMILSNAIMVVGATLILFVREPLAALFMSDDPVALSLTVDYMFFILLGLPLMAVFQTFIGTFNGTGNTQYTFILSVTRLWVIRIPLVLFMARIFPARGSQVIWEAMLLSNLLIAVIGYILYKRITFKPKVDTQEKIIQAPLKPSPSYK